jgi:hypothetical protein
MEWNTGAVSEARALGRRGEGGSLGGDTPEKFLQRNIGSGLGPMDVSPFEFIEAASALAPR